MITMNIFCQWLADDYRNMYGTARILGTKGLDNRHDKYTYDKSDGERTGDEKITRMENIERWERDGQQGRGQINGHACSVEVTAEEQTSK